MFGSLLTFPGTCGYYGTYALAIYETVKGTLSIGTLTFLAGAIAGASSGIQTLFQTFSSIADQAMFLSDLLECFKVKPAIVSKPDTRKVPRPICTGIEFRNVSFEYPGNPRRVLQNVSFMLRRANAWRQLGRMAREKRRSSNYWADCMIRPKDRSCWVAWIREYEVEDLWKQIGVIFQDFMKYEMTASDNIAVGRLDVRGDTEKSALRLRTAARRT